MISSAAKEQAKHSNPDDLKCQKKKIKNEICIHKLFSHKNICKFEHYFEDQKNVYMLMELCSDKTLADVLKRRKRLLEIEVQCYIK